MLEVSTQDITFNLVNPRQIIENSDTFYLVDVISFSKTGLKMGSGQIYINYDTAAFGPNVVLNNNVTLLRPDSTLLTKQIGSSPFLINFYGDFISNDNTNSRLSFSWQHDFSKACLIDENINFYADLLITLKIKYKIGSTNLYPNVCFEDGANYIHQIFTACGPNDCNTNDCFNFPGNQLQNDQYPCTPDCRIVYATANDGIGSLRAAIFCASNGDTILFAPNMKYDTIQLLDTAILLNKDLNILPKPFLTVYINGQSAPRIFEIEAGKNVIMESLYIMAGLDQDCSSILNAGNLSLKNLTIKSQQSSMTNSQIKNIGVITAEGLVRLEGQW